jgi:hypothetical protein
MKKVTVYCGITIQYKCDKQLHPIREVEKACALINTPLDEFNEIAYSNHPDFVSAVKYIGKKQGVETEFFLNGVSHGSDIEPIFGDFNRALDMVNELGATEE